MGQYRRTNTKNKIGNTARETLSISRHMIFSTPVSVSVHATDSKLCRRAGFGGPPLPCKEVCSRFGTEKSNHNRILECNMLLIYQISAKTFITIPKLTISLRDGRQKILFCTCIDICGCNIRNCAKATYLARRGRGLRGLS